MKKRRGWSLVGIPLLVSVISLVGCAGDTGAGAGGAEGKITLYSPETPDMSKEIGQAYEKANPGSKVDVQYGGTNVIVNRLIAEKDRPMGDLWYGGGDFYLLKQPKEKGLSPLTNPTSPRIGRWRKTVSDSGIKIGNG